LAVVTLKTSSTVVMPWRTRRQPFRQRVHAGPAGGVANLIGRGILQNQPADFRRSESIHSKNRMPAMKAGIPAFPAADGLIDRRIGRNADARFESLGGGE